MANHMRVTTTVDPADPVTVDYPYECPECGAGHHGDETGTELCRDCTENR